MIYNRLGILVGMDFEARLASTLAPVAVEASGATYLGAKKALERLSVEKIDSIVSFGFAAGLDPVIKAGTILLPHSVVAENREYHADAELRSWLGAEKSEVKLGSLLHSNEIVTSAQKKERLFKDSACLAVDMESGLVAQFAQEKHIPFAVLRVVCDTASRNLPPLVSSVLTQDGKLNFSRIAGSLLTRPFQIKDLFGVGMDMARAYWHLKRYLANFH